MPRRSYRPRSRLCRPHGEAAGVSGCNEDGGRSYPCFHISECIRRVQRIFGIDHKRPIHAVDGTCGVGMPARAADCRRRFELGRGRQSRRADAPMRRHTEIRIGGRDRLGGLPAASWRSAAGWGCMMTIRFRDRRLHRGRACDEHGCRALEAPHANAWPSPSCEAFGSRGSEIGLLVCQSRLLSS